MDLDAILRQLPIDDIAQQFGVSTDVARQAAEEGSAALVGGLAKNAETPEGSDAIEKALQRHEGFSGATKIDDVDQVDGGKIVKHVFGDNEKDVAETLNKSEKTAGGIDFGKLLPILAPIVLGLIANANKGKSTGGAQDGESGGGLGDILGGLLGGGQGGAASGGGGLGDILGGLGGLLGGGSSSSSSSQGGGNVITDLLGGLFGGKR